MLAKITKLDVKLYLQLQRSLPLRLVNTGFVLPIVIALGTAVIILGLKAALITQTDSKAATGRLENQMSLTVAESAVDRVLALLTRPDNNLLLGRNYDPNALLGPDLIPKSGDEIGSNVDEWTTCTVAACNPQGNALPPVLAQLTDNIGSQGAYSVLAYRYDSTQQQATLLVEGRYRNMATERLSLTLRIRSNVQNFPGIAISDPYPGSTFGNLGLRGRMILGSNASIYYSPTTSANPAITGQAALGELDRAAHLEAIYSSAADGANTDTVEGTLIAHDVEFASMGFPTAPSTATPILPIVNTQTLHGQDNQITSLRVPEIRLGGSDQLRVDTTHGPVHLYLEGPIILSSTAQILNVRTDGKQPQVGDLRIFILDHLDSVELRHTSCIQNAFIYTPGDDLELLTSGPGCPGGRNSNFEGVFWGESLAAAKQSAMNRDITDLYVQHSQVNSLELPGITSGLYIPNDLSSLYDLAPLINLSVRYRVDGISKWQRVRI